MNRDVAKIEKQLSSLAEEKISLKEQMTEKQVRIDDVELRLEDRKGDPEHDEWRRRALFFRRSTLAQVKKIGAEIKVINMRARELEKIVIGEAKHKKEQERMRRLKSTDSINLEVFKEFKKLARSELGEDRFIELIESASSTVNLHLGDHGQ